VPHDAEAGVTVGAAETVGLGPAVEADAKAVRLENAVHFGKGGAEPCAVVVVHDGAAIAGLVARDIRRVGQDEIDAVGGKLRENIEAVAVDEGVAVSHG
jgi:hypothetical protein